MIGQSFLQSIKILSIDHIRNLDKEGPKNRKKSETMIQNNRDKETIFNEPIVHRIFKVSSYSIVLRSYAQTWISYGDDEYETEFLDGELKLIFSPMTLKFKGGLIKSAFDLFKYKKGKWVLKKEEQ
jgi:hypothetical protein